MPSCLHQAPELPDHCTHLLWETNLHVCSGEPVGPPCQVEPVKARIVSIPLKNHIQHGTCYCWPWEICRISSKLRQLLRGIRSQHKVHIIANFCGLAKFQYFFLGPSDHWEFRAEFQNPCPYDTNIIEVFYTCNLTEIGRSWVQGQSRVHTGNITFTHPTKEDQKQRESPCE